MGVSDPRFNQAIEYIDKHISKPELSALEVANKLHMSRRSLFSLFGKYGQTPASMITRLRLEKSAELLRSPLAAERKITDIAFDLGFNNYTTFSRLFRKYFKEAPREYRASFWTL